MIEPGGEDEGGRRRCSTGGWKGVCGILFMRFL
jgi:hypothetical protein